jgi:hypothetical protein
LKKLASDPQEKFFIAVARAGGGNTIVDGLLWLTVEYSLLFILFNPLKVIGIFSSPPPYPRRG